MFETALNSYGRGRAAMVLECILQSTGRFQATKERWRVAGRSGSPQPLVIRPEEAQNRGTAYRRVRTAAFSLIVSCPGSVGAEAGHWVFHRERILGHHPV